VSGTDPIVVVVRWTVEPGSLDALLALVAEMRRSSLTEPGCLGYEVYRSLEAPRELLLLERYANAAALDAHRTSLHYQSIVVQRILPLLSDRKVELLHE
jgi:quinol monooxygenase YgiN